MREGITLAGSSNAVRSPTREACGASGTTLSNNKASNVDYLNEIKKNFIPDQRSPPDTGHRESPGLVYTRSSFSGGSSSCGYNEYKSSSQEVASQKSENTDPCIRSPSSSQTNPKSDSQVSRVSQNNIDCEEVATPFDKVDNFKDILLALTDAVQTLLHVHAAGWVHRDISIRNVYLYTDRVTQKKKGMIGDFEYAKKAGIGSQNDIRTGTPDFMPVEVADQVYYFSEQSTGAGKTMDDYIQEREAYEKNRETNDTSKGVYYNYIHDLESVWWIVVWALFNFEKKDARTDSYTTRQRKLNKDKLFSGIIDSNYRFRFLSIRESYAETIRCLPKYFKSLSAMLGTIAKVITELYRKKESNEEWNKGDPILWDESSNIHKIFIGLLDDVTMEQFEIVRVPGIDEIQKEVTRGKDPL
ncbi:hypothetical protein PNOK_0673700 [Pyrrhoderma noxium]|uniref:Fungal-type protein kinase domain-containing protein n=1 Tax=Pyrrhoderma noxium TaxID=2282107 RepID=A0A286UF78_9AGAM|nr:hypothetical protein PNOK_0673700 [Pyrrhoderma noxium]